MTTLNLNTLKAVSLMSSKEETRYYLGGVYIEAGPDSVIYVATDGHRLAAVRETIEPSPDNWQGSVIIPAAICNGAKWRKGADPRELAATLRPAEGAKFTLNAPALDHCVQFAPIDGTFPDWRRVVPRGAPSGLGAQFNGDYLASFVKFGKMLGHHLPKVCHDGPEKPAVVRWGEDADVFGVIMPYRHQPKLAGAPAWVFPTAPAEKKAA